MDDLKKYKRFFAFGCSMTSYRWPTWADILAKEIPESYNFGKSGGGNLYISTMLAEAHNHYKFNAEDLVMIMWTSVCREDRYINKYWETPGNIFTQGFYDDAFVEKYADPRGYLIRDMAIISNAKHMLDSLPCDYHMLNMAPFVTLQLRGGESNADDFDDVLELYKDVLKYIKPDIMNLEYKGQWPQHPISDPGNQKFDYHPSTAGHARYLQKVFPRLTFTEQQQQFIDKHEEIIMSASTTKDLEPHWMPQSPQIL